MHRALLIDDEAPARADLRAKLGAHAEVAVVGEAATYRSAQALLARTDYDLVFLDIHLIGGNAFDLVADVRAGARIIFATAHDNYALRAFAINALDYLLKPIEPARLADALRRLPAVSVKMDAAPGPAATPLKFDDVIYLRAGNRARFARVDEISVITAHDNYSEVLLADGARILLRKSLKDWEETLPSTPFMRVHRTCIVNLSRLIRYQRDADEHTQLFIAGVDAPIAASRERWTELRDRLTALRPQP